MATTRLNIPTSGDAGKTFAYDLATDRMVVTERLVVNVKDPPFGAKGDVRSFTDGVITSGSLGTLTSATAGFTSADVGKTVGVAGAGTGGAPFSTTIATVPNSTTATLTSPAVTAVSGAAFSYGTNDTAAIQAAIDAAYTARPATVMLPGGAYGIVWSGANSNVAGFYGLRLKTGVTLLAYGATLKVLSGPGAGGNGGLVGNDQSLGVSDIAVEGVTCDLSLVNSASQAVGIYFGNPFSGSVGATRLRVERCWAHHAYIGIRVNDSADFTVSRNRVNNMTYIGIQAAASHDGSIDHNRVDTTVDNGIDIYGDTGTTGAPNTYNVSVDDNHCTNVRVGVFLETVNSCSAAGNTINATEKGVFVNRMNSDALYNRVEGNTITAPQAGVLLNGPVFETAVTGNTIHLTANGGVGIDVNNAWRGAMTGNTIVGNGNADSGIGFRFHATSSYWSLTGNFAKSIQATVTIEDTCTQINRLNNTNYDVGNTTLANSFDPFPQYAADGDGSQMAALPYLLGALADYNDVTTGMLTVLSLGSSVGVGAALANPSTDAPGAYFTTALAAKINKLGNYSVQHYNGSVNGHVFADAQADYVTAKASATGKKVVVPMVFGMNDGRSDSYHSGETYPGVRIYIGQIAADIRKDHADPLLFTTPHPHTGRMTWTTTSPIVYPATGVMTPDATTGQSIKSITIASGRTINVSYRHLRVNDSIRRTGAELGITVVDVEKYWFEAVADRGEDALFDVSENVHPNLLGHQLSYWRAIDHWVKGFETSKVVANMPPTAQVTWTEQFNVQIASPIHLTFIDQQYAVLLVRAAHGGVAARHAEAYLCLGDFNGGTGSGVRVVAMGQLLGNVVTVSTSGYDVVITPNFNGATVAYTLIQGYPLP